MNKDEQAIRNLVDTWLAASKEGDLAAVLSLMADDVVFMAPGQEPFGKEEFAAHNRNMKNLRIEGTSEIQEIDVLGDRAWLRNRLKVTFTPPDGKPMVHSGYTAYDSAEESRRHMASRARREPVDAREQTVNIKRAEARPPRLMEFACSH